MIGLVLLIAIFAVYSQVGRFDFIAYDDNGYITDNPQVQSGLNLASMKWALTATITGHWTPVTVFSHLLACQLFHQQSGMHHLINVLFHTLATLFLFGWLKRATGALWPSAFVAFIFAAHPLHVESVAWVSERKDVLCAFFWFAALYLYVRYAKRPSIGGYLSVTVVFSLGLMAKSMLVTFPFTLLLLDIWPLRRKQFPMLLWEKIPLVGLSAAASYITYRAQSSAGAVQAFPLAERIGNSIVSYVVYLRQMIWPTPVAVIYPWQPPAMWQVVASAIILISVTAAVLIWRTKPYLAVGWFWYLGTLLPVIGLVQAGTQAHADHFMYVPMIGLLLMLAWGGWELQARWPGVRRPLAIAAVVCGISCVLVAHAQTEYWENTETLFDHALAVTRDNYVADYTLGNYLMNSGRPQEAVVHFEDALRAKPDYPEAQNNLGIALASIPGRATDAVSHFEAAVRLNPGFVSAHRNLAQLLEQIPGKRSEALAQYQLVEKLEPSRETATIIQRLRAEQQ